MITVINAANLAAYAVTKSWRSSSTGSRWSMPPATAGWEHTRWALSPKLPTMMLTVISPLPRPPPTLMKTLPLPFDVREYKIVLIQDGVKSVWNYKFIEWNTKRFTPHQLHFSIRKWHVGRFGLPATCSYYYTSKVNPCWAFFHNFKSPWNVDASRRDLSGYRNLGWGLWSPQCPVQSSVVQGDIIGLWSDWSNML